MRSPSAGTVLLGEWERRGMVDTLRRARGKHLDSVTICVHYWMLNNEIWGNSASLVLPRKNKARIRPICSTEYHHQAEMLLEHWNPWKGWGSKNGCITWCTVDQRVARAPNRSYRTFTRRTDRLVARRHYFSIPQNPKLRFYIECFIWPCRIFLGSATGACHRGVEPPTIRLTMPLLHPLRHHYSEASAVSTLLELAISWLASLCEGKEINWK